MQTTIDVIYDGKALWPHEPLDLKPNSHYSVTINAAADTLEALAIAPGINRSSSASADQEPFAETVPDIHDLAWSLYNRDLKADLEREHLGQVVAIDPVSGSYEVARNSPDARRALRKRCPDGPFVAIRIGVVPVDNPLSLRARNALRRTKS
jgi:hypothetical protein